MSGTRKLAAILAADFLGHWRFPDIPRADRNGAVAQTAAIRRRLGERAVDPELPFKVDSMNGRKARERGLRLKEVAPAVLKRRRERLGQSSDLLFGQGPITRYPRLPGLARG